MTRHPILFVTRAALYRRGEQRGERRDLSWAELGDLLSRPSIAETKDAAGGFSPASYVGDIRRKANLTAIWVLVIDVDGGGDVDLVADELAVYDAIVTETFSSTNDEPRCRLLVRVAEPVDAATYEAAHAVVRAKLRTELAIQPDDGAKDASRLSYLPVRRPGAGYRFRVTEGKALDARKVAALLPRPVARPRVEVAPQHRDSYRRAALRRAAEAVGSAPSGARHEVLNKQAYALARLDLSEAEIRDALLPAAVAAMGEARAREAMRTIGDAVRAKRGAA